MNIDYIFEGLPYGFLSFEKIKDSLIDCRARQRLPQNAKTVISVLFPYYLGEKYYSDSNVSRYAVSADYHIITKSITERIVNRLKNEYPEHCFEAFVDNSPLPEVRCAALAGLGVIGTNNLFISPRYGSWVFLGEIVTDKYFEPFNKKLSFCTGCSVCVKSCPVGALGEGGIDKEKCLSYLSQKKGELSDDVKQKIIEYNCAWGCDICQKVCPMNIKAEVTPIKEFFETANPKVGEDDSIEGRAFAWRGTEVIKRNIKALNSTKDKTKE